MSTLCTVLLGCVEVVMSVPENKVQADTHDGCAES